MLDEVDHEKLNMGLGTTSVQTTLGILRLGEFFV
jgi:hypothetical protein